MRVGPTFTNCETNSGCVLDASCFVALSQSSGLSDLWSLSNLVRNQIDAGIRNVTYHVWGNTQTMNQKSSSMAFDREGEMEAI